MTPLQLANLGLHKIGVTQGVEALDDTTREAYTAGLVFNTRLRGALRRFPWAFATKYRAAREDARHTLLLTAGPFWETDPDLLTTVQEYDATATYERGDVVRSSGVNYYALRTTINDTPASSASDWSSSEDDRPDNCGNGDWMYAYRWPDDCVFVRRIVPVGEDGRQFNPNPPNFRIGRDANGLLIYTNEEEAEIEYTMIDCDNLQTDDLFIDYFTWTLAGDFAPGLSRNGLTQEKCYAFAESIIREAATVNLQESQQHPGGDPDWIRNR